MKIVIIPGVGYQKDNSKENCLGRNIQKEIQCDFEIFNWDHTILKYAMKSIMEMYECKEISYSDLRKFIAEVIFDFEFAIKYGGMVDIPEADYYIGHSAGSLFSMSQSKPSAMMGSPVSLVKYLPKISNEENYFINSILDSDKPILNIVNKYDVIAYPMQEPWVKNVYFRESIFNPISYFPLTAHLCYWKNKFVAKEIAKHIKEVTK